ncbi:hypothetical protein [Chryseobacterium sp. MFBS3-17]|uniref:hypothetical protein n=1 Tax=Chryseobacterium sp. MFBS3-17 TaxID=2886689 RepID=UPI001D0DDE7F|nr:hypothetical protein [Chryseobacterium sp. MFBS3-17]MCC2590263.1 hypothetical protein [Chryseobacterium sp. MFBS3-17]
MKKLTTVIFLGCMVGYSALAHAQTTIQNLNTLLGTAAPGTSSPGISAPGISSPGISSPGTALPSGPDIAALQQAFFGVHGSMSVQDNQSVIWERAGNPVHAMMVQQAGEITAMLSGAHADQVFRIRQLRIRHSAIGTGTELIAAVQQMPNLEQIFIIGETNMPSDINTQLAAFRTELEQNQINPVNVYYYNQGISQ